MSLTIATAVDSRRLGRYSFSSVCMHAHIISITTLNGCLFRDNTHPRTHSHTHCNWVHTWAKVQLAEPISSSETANGSAPLYGSFPKWYAADINRAHGYARRCCSSEGLAHPIERNDYCIAQITITKAAHCNFILTGIAEEECFSSRK